MRILFCVSLTAVILLFACQKDPASPSNTPVPTVSYLVDSMRYTYKDEDLNRIPIKSLYVFTYSMINGENKIAKIKRIDTMFGPSLNTANYVDKEYSYDNQGRLINVFSKSRRMELISLPTLNGNGEIENYNLWYSYVIPNNYGFPSAVLIEIYKDSSASTVLRREKYTSIDPFNGYQGTGLTGNLYYSLSLGKDAAAFSDPDNWFWGGPSNNSSFPDYSIYWFFFNQKGFVDEFRAIRRPYYFFLISDTQDDRRVHFQYDSSLLKFMGSFMGKTTFKYGIAADILLDRCKELSNQDPFRGFVNELKNLSLSSTDSTMKLDSTGRLTQLVEKINTEGSLTLDSSGRISKLVKRHTTTRTEWPVGTFRTTQTFEFFYKK